MSSGACSVDALIFDLMNDQWQKVAMIIAKALRDSQNNAIDDELIAKRINEMVSEGKLESRGNLADWRHSEVRLRIQPK